MGSEWIMRKNTRKKNVDKTNRRRIECDEQETLELLYTHAQ